MLTPWKGLVLTLGIAVWYTISRRNWVSNPRQHRQKLKVEIVHHSQCRGVVVVNPDQEKGRMLLTTVCGNSHQRSRLHFFRKQKLCAVPTRIKFLV